MGHDLGDTPSGSVESILQEQLTGTPGARGDYTEPMKIILEIDNEGLQKDAKSFFETVVVPMYDQSIVKPEWLEMEGPAMAFRLALTHKLRQSADAAAYSFGR